MVLAPLLTFALLTADPEEPIPPDLADAQLAARAETAFQEGVRLRQSGDAGREHFRRAAASFEELRRRGMHNAALYRDLGHAYLLADDLPHAMLSFRRGLRLAPDDPGLRASLAEARGLVVYSANDPLGRPAPETAPPWLPRLLARALVLGGTLPYLGGCLCLTRWLMTRRARWWVLGGGALVAALAVALAGSEWWRRAEAEARQPLAVVVDDGVLLRKGNSLAFPPRYETPVNRGVEARVLFERDGWVQLELAGGEVGWVPRNAVNR